MRTLLLWLLALTLTVPFSARAETDDEDGDLNEISDPFEGMNRGIFWFNERLDRYLLEPVADGYDAVVPDPIQRGVTNFFENLSYPKYFLSDVVQLKFTQAAEHTGRFLINTTLGVGGIFDIASDLGLEKEEEDFGIALAYHGVPSGPYLVLPFFGPSNVRDAFGKAVDTLVHPFMILSYTDVRAGVTDPIAYGGRSLDVVQTRVDLDEAIKAGRESSFDYYLFLQGAYTQYRRGILYDGEVPESEE